MRNVHFRIGFGANGMAGKKGGTLKPRREGTSAPRSPDRWEEGSALMRAEAGA